MELGHVGMLPAWGDNNRNELAAGKAKTPVIKPVLIDREIPKVQARLDELNKAAQDGGQLSAEQKQEFIEVTKQAEGADGSARADSGAHRRRVCD